MAAPLTWAQDGFWPPSSGGGMIGRPSFPDRGWPSSYTRPTQPPGDSACALVQSWYQRYLHGPADPDGLQAWVGLLRNGQPPEEVQAGILASEEYYRNHGSDPRAYIEGLYSDVLGRNANRQEVRGWLETFERDRGDRQRLARQFVRAAQPELQSNRSIGYYRSR
jgi:hypothetical protein